MTEPDYQIGIGDTVRILESRVHGHVTAFTCSMRREDSYLVEYVDANGNPQEREWSESQLQLVQKADGDEIDWSQGEDNVVPLRRVH